MRITLNIEDDLLAKAQRVSGLKETTALVREGLKALIERESARRLARWAVPSRSCGVFRGASPIGHDPGR